jgi:hypothetical protein
VAVTAALEGVAGHLRLADFDQLELSNMNRIRAGVHHLGVDKVVLAARQIFELDPYVTVSILPDGLTRENIDAFIDGNDEFGPALDVVVDECDSFDVKLLVREVARTRGVPVLMETSDRGVLDIERFDLEPDRPLLHGLIGDVTASDLPEASALDAIPTLGLRMYNAESLSTRMAAALIEVDTTLSTWPQLATDVALGGASVTVAEKPWARAGVDDVTAASPAHAWVPAGVASNRAGVRPWTLTTSTSEQPTAQPRTCLRRVHASPPSPIS